MSSGPACVIVQVDRGSPLNTSRLCQDTWTPAGTAVPGRGDRPCLFRSYNARPGAEGRGHLDAQLRVQPQHAQVEQLVV